MILLSTTDPRYLRRLCREISKTPSVYLNKTHTGLPHHSKIIFNPRVAGDSILVKYFVGVCEIAEVLVGGCDTAFINGATGEYIFASRKP